MSARCTAARCRAHRRHLLGRERPDAGDAGAGRRRRRGGRGHAGLAQPAAQPAILGARVVRLPLQVERGPGGWISIRCAMR